MNTLEKLLAAFSSRRRPTNFTDYTHCHECADHNETLRSRDLDSLSFNDVGSVGYSPIGYISLDGFLYYLPALARLANATGDKYFLDTFLIYMENKEWRIALTTSEREALVDYLVNLKISLADEIQKNNDERDLEELIEWFSD